MLREQLQQAAELLVDGVQRGSATQTLRLPARPHEIVVRVSGGGTSFDETITISVTDVAGVVINGQTGGILLVLFFGAGFFFAGTFLATL